MDTVKIAAHSIKGSAAVFGAMELSKAAEELEFAVKVGEGKGPAKSSLSQNNTIQET